MRLVVVTVVAMFVTTAALQTRNDRPATELERRTLAADIEARQKTLDERRDHGGRAERRGAVTAEANNAEQGDRRIWA